MAEPEYIFKKGEGWVLKPPFEQLVVTMCCGTRVRLERRKPLLGELCIWHNTGQWQLTDWENWAHQNYYTSFKEGYSHYRESHYDWMVAIKL